MRQYDKITLQDQEYLVLAVEGKKAEEQAQPAENVPADHYFIQERRLMTEAGDPVRFTGGMVIARELNAIPLTEEQPFCCQYNEVLELIFENGCATALADHSRAMKKVLKNLEYKLRSLQKRRDVFVIEHFLKKTFVRKYPVRWIHRIR